jgi:DNA-binding transcriptional ArsR family regulator
MQSVLKALNDPLRRQILELLKVGDMSAGDIADKFEVSKPTISHHLDILKQAELIIATKKGQFIFYSLSTTIMDELIAWMIQFSDKNKK